jgi:hypothetical protein
MPKDQYFPLCGMNLAFHREALPLMYFPHMGQGSLYSRFDDIWCGLLFQQVLRPLRFSWTVGEPFVHHQRASNALENLVREAAGIRDHPPMWRLIEQSLEQQGRAELQAQNRGALEQATLLAAQALAGYSGPSRLGSYVQAWGQNLLTWLQLIGVDASGLARAA